MDIISYILSKKYTDNTVDGLGAIKGAPCAVESVVDIDGGKRITLEWESNSGVKQTRSFDIMDGEDGANTVEWSQIQQSGTKIAEININGVSTDVYAPTGGGGGSELDAIETTSSAYAQLPSADKQDATKIYFLNDTQSGTQDTPIDATTFINRAENSRNMSLSVIDGKLTYQYLGGANIGANSYRNIAIPSTVSKIKFKLTTGTSYSTGTNPNWVVCIGVKASQYTDWINPTDSNWLVKKEFDTRNSSYEDYLDLSDISTDCYLMIVAHGWTVTFDEITIEEPLAPTGETKIKYKDIAYGIGSDGSGDGMFVDFDNLITSGTYIASTPLSYTATVDCYILIASVNWGSQRTKIYIDGVEINNLYSTQSFVQTVGYFLKKGQVCTATTDCSQENSGYAVYGLQQGSNVQHNYSTSEQLIGTWIDGKPLYQKTWSNLAITLLSPNTWVSTGIPATEIDTIVDGTMQDDNRQKLCGTIGFTSSDTYIGVCPQIGDCNITTLTIQYTKKADT